MDNKMGIENLTKVLLLMIAIADSADFIGKHTELGVARFAKLTDCFDEAMAMGSFKLADFKAEITELDAEEKAKLNMLFKAKFDIEDDLLEAKIEQAIDLFGEGYSFIMKIVEFTKTMKA